MNLTCFDSSGTYMPSSILLLIKDVESLEYSTKFYHYGKTDEVDRALDSRSEGLGFNSQHWSCVEVLGKFIFHTALIYQTVMDTWCSDPRLDQ